MYANRAPELLTNYMTTMPLTMYYTILGISMLFILSMYLAAAVLVLGIAWFFLERAFGPGCIPGWTGQGAEYYRDAFCVGLFGSSVVLGLNHLPALFARWPVLRHALGISAPQGLDLLNPAAGTIAFVTAFSLFAVGGIGLIAGLVAAYVRPAWMRVGLLVLYAVLMVTNVATAGGFLREGALQLVTITALSLGVVFLARFNVMAYFLLVAVTLAVPRASGLFSQPNAYFRMNGAIVIAFAAALLVWPVVLWWRGDPF
ncbi:MAG: hypothetical protein ACRD4Y_12035, partial [Candidatus Acidiferrales bacterium]